MTYDFNLCYLTHSYKQTFSSLKNHRTSHSGFLLNLDINYAYYDPKTLSMRKDPLLDFDPNEKIYGVSTYGIMAIISKSSLLF